MVFVGPTAVFREHVGPQSKALCAFALSPSSVRTLLVINLYRLPPARCQSQIWAPKWRENANCLPMVSLQQQFRITIGLEACSAANESSWCTKVVSSCGTKVGQKFACVRVSVSSSPLQRKRSPCVCISLHTAVVTTVVAAASKSSLAENLKTVSWRTRR